MEKQFSIALNSAELIKYAFYKEYHLPPALAHINLTQERILMTINSGMHLNMVSIARAIGLEKGPFSQSVDKLERLGYVKRERSTSDKRQIRLLLTADGMAICQQVAASMESHFAKKLNNLTAEELAELDTALASLKKIAHIIISK